MFPGLTYLAQELNQNDVYIHNRQCCIMYTSETYLKQKRNFGKKPLTMVGYPVRYSLWST